jgi:hypothetical protein
MTPSGLLAGLQGSGAADGDGSLAAPPPPRFRAAVGVKWAEFGYAPVAEKPPVGLAQKAGVRYEKKAIDYLRSEWAPAFHANRWIQFGDVSGIRWCRPDVLWLPSDSDLCVICEIKIQHMPEAFWQLQHLYLPVVKVLFPKKRYLLLELVGSYDPAMNFPPHSLLNSLKEVRYLPADMIGVLPWKTA